VRARRGAQWFWFQWTSDMQIELENMVETIRQSVGLLRRRL
jgi:hypothetical protein